MSSKVIQSKETQENDNFENILSQREVSFPKNQNQSPISIVYHAHGHLNPRSDNNTGIPGIKEVTLQGRAAYRINNNMGIYNTVTLHVYIGGGQGKRGPRIAPEYIGKNKFEALLKAVIIRQKMQTINHLNNDSMYNRNQAPKVTQKTIRKNISSVELNQNEWEMVKNTFDNWAKRVESQ